LFDFDRKDHLPLENRLCERNSTPRACEWLSKLFQLLTLRISCGVREPAFFVVRARAARRQLNAHVGRP
jgi:hypothetical protein